jgi:hypothetical protein
MDAKEILEATEVGALKGLCIVNGPPAGVYIASLIDDGRTVAVSRIETTEFVDIEQLSPSTRRLIRAVCA